MCVAVSIFFGYVAYLFIQSMLRDGLFESHLVKAPVASVRFRYGSNGPSGEEIPG